MSHMQHDHSMGLHPFIEGLVDIFRDAAVILQSPAVHQEENQDVYGLEVLFSGMLLRVLHHANPIFDEVDRSQQTEIAQLVSNELIHWAANSYRQSIEQADREFGELIHYIRFSVWEESDLPINEMQIEQAFTKEAAMASALYIYGMLTEADARLAAHLQEEYNLFSLHYAIEATTMLLLELSDTEGVFWQLSSDEISETATDCIQLINNWLQQKFGQLSFLAEEQGSYIIEQLTSGSEQLERIIQKAYFSK